MKEDIFKTKNIDEILTIINDNLDKEESLFWRDKIVPFSEAILSVLVPLREQNKLFNPEGEFQNKLTFDLFLRWCDFVSLKMLYFTLKESNKKQQLLRTKLEDTTYENIDLSKLESYLKKYSVNTDNEIYDFPIANYNLHVGVRDSIKKILS